MVRIPASWARAGYARYAGSISHRGIAARRIPVPGDEQFRNQVTVDLGNDGIAPQSTFNGYTAVTGGPVTSPGAFANIVFTQVPAGTYPITWTVTLAGTLSGSDVNNFALYVNGVFIASSVNPATAGTYTQTTYTASPNGSAGDIKILTNGAGTTGSQYSASLGAVTGTATAFIGPSSGGDLWSLDQCYLATSVGQLDIAQCTVYAGPLPLPQYAVTGSLAGGSSQFGMGGVGVPFGWFAWAVWTGGTPGATTMFRLTGVKTVLTN